ncbi:MAG: hypothetical protein E4H10_08305 [Bacteroidia bacterium]|jgi:hypothetical protein|nr:MAG: hypothetical protein E4H10_08305 [Bacteroidia bacterium]
MKNIAFVLALVLFSSMAIGQKVNYSGEWKLNESKSQLGYDFSLAPASISITHTKKALDLKTVNVWDGTEVVSESHITLDGSETENKGFGESIAKSTAEVDKATNAIKIVTKGSAEGVGDWTSTQNMLLKEGNLVIQFEAVSDMGEIAETYVFDKQ